MLLFLEPTCLKQCFLSYKLLCILYLFFCAFDLSFCSFDLVFRNVYHFKLWQVGLTFLGLLIGMLLAIASGPFWDWNYLRLMRKKEKETGQEDASEPEFRLPPSIGGAPLC